jgi:hypothetical protein
MVEETNTIPCIEGGRSHCSKCNSALCVRKQVINLALGNVDDMFCLICLGKDSEREPEEVLEGIKTYILSRPCFKKEWVKYPDVSYCPEPESCFPGMCFQSNDSDE